MEDFIPTRGSQLRSDASKSFVKVNYEARKKKSANEAQNVDDNSKAQNSMHRLPNNKQDGNVDPKRQQELEMKRIRYEVMKFGMSGFQKAKAKKAKVSLAISLGAVPPRNRKINYKILKAKRLKQKEAQKRMEPVSGLNKSLVKHKPKSKTRKKDSSGILGVYGKVDRGIANKKRS